MGLPIACNRHVPIAVGKVALHPIAGCGQGVCQHLGGGRMGVQRAEIQRRQPTAVLAQRRQHRHQVDAGHAIGQRRCPQRGVVVGQRAHPATQPRQRVIDIERHHRQDDATPPHRQETQAAAAGHHGALKVTPPAHAQAGVDLRAFFKQRLLLSGQCIHLTPDFYLAWQTVRRAARRRAARGCKHLLDHVERHLHGLGSVLCYVLNCALTVSPSRLIGVNIRAELHGYARQGIKQLGQGLLQQQPAGRNCAQVLVMRGLQHHQGLVLQDGHSAADQAAAGPQFEYPGLAGLGKVLHDVLVKTVLRRG